jgi:hypothetical protein
MIGEQARWNDAEVMWGVRGERGDERLLYDANAWMMLAEIDVVCLRLSNKPHVRISVLL